MIQAEMVRLNETLTRSQEALLRCRNMQHGGIQGWLYRTTGPWIFVGLSIGKIVVESQTVLVIGAEAPLAKLLKDKGVGDEVVVGATKIQITDIQSLASA
jgi:hypothetical protein